VILYKKKLIEVALPLEAINKESAREKSIRHGHPSTLHLWWARRPLAACRAVLFSSLVDDPSAHPDKFPTEDAQETERQRLFKILEDLVKWENSNNERVLNAARQEILRSTDGKPPPVLDPFCGGGSIPLEAQRLGLEVYASDLNPVAVLITKALVEIPRKFAGRPPVYPKQPTKLLEKDWQRAEGLAEDVRYYGKWMRDEAEKRVGHLYPQVKLPKERGGGQATVIAWLWARMVKCPNPACGAQMPLVRSFELSKKKGKKAWVVPTPTRVGRARFDVVTGSSAAPSGTVGRKGGRCIACESPVPFKHIRAEGQAGRMEVQLMAIVAEGTRTRVYLPPLDDHVEVAASAKPSWRPEVQLPDNPRDFKTPNYGMTSFADLFTPRQLVALTTFSDLVQEARERVKADAVKAGMSDDGKPLAEGGNWLLAVPVMRGRPMLLGGMRWRLLAVHSLVRLCRWFGILPRRIPSVIHVVTGRERASNGSRRFYRLSPEARPVTSSNSMQRAPRTGSLARSYAPILPTTTTLGMPTFPISSTRGCGGPSVKSSLSSSRRC
jgi:putative DNA methylase